MRVSSHGVGAVVAGILLASSSLAAQNAVRPTFGVSGGVAFPTGDLGDSFKSGYDIAVHLGFRPAAAPFGVRLEGMYNRFDLKGTNALGIHTNVIAGTANLVIAGTPEPGSIRPYVIGGAGVYNAKVDATNASGASSDTKFGLNGGAGLDMPLSGIAVFVEARYHYVFGDRGANGSNLAFIPLVVGVRF